MTRNDSMYLVTRPDGTTIGLHFRWTVSRGLETDGWNISTVYANGDKVGRCNGGGYDMQGTCLAQWFTKEAGELVKKLPSNYGSGDHKDGFYGLRHWNTKTNKSQHRNTGPHCETTLDGGCGFDSVRRVMERLKYKLQYVRSGYDK